MSKNSPSSAPAAPVLVTGGAGFIGSALVWHLTQQGTAVAVVDELGADERFRNLCGLPIADYWEKDDFAARLEAERPLPPFAAVVHLGACSSTTEPDGSYLMRNNFGFSRLLATWCLRHGVRLIYASSAATYGDGSLGFDDDVAGLPRLRPLNKYAFSKHAFDLWALRQGVLAGPEAITGLKFFNVYGPNEYHKGEMRSMVLKAYEQIQASGRVRLFQSHRTEYGDGEQKRDFLYVKDAAAITAWLLEHPQATGIYNVGSGTARTWNDLARAVFAAMGRPPEIEYIPMPEPLQAQYQYRTHAPLHRLRRAGWSGSVRSLEAGVEDYVRSYLQSADPYLAGGGEL